jgi:hypothetical protein
MDDVKTPMPEQGGTTSRCAREAARSTQIVDGNARLLKVARNRPESIKETDFTREAGTIEPADDMADHELSPAYLTLGQRLKNTD